MSIRITSPAGISQAQGDSWYLKLDQTTVQHVINGLPQFDQGITIKKDQWIFLDGA